MSASQETRNYPSVFLTGGSTYPELTEAIAREMDMEVGPMDRQQFPNSEVYVRFGESVRDDHVVLVQSMAARPDWSVNDSFVELALMAAAARGASAREITAVMPYLAYSRQDRKARGREPVSAAETIRMLACVGVDRIVTVDLHSPQLQGIFPGPFDHLTAEPLIQRALDGHIASDPEEDYIVVAPDAGRAKAAEHYSENLTELALARGEDRAIGFVTMSKRRQNSGDGTASHQKPEGVKGKNCLMGDDMIDTAGTLVSAVHALEDAGANRVIVSATHGLFSGPALERLAASAIDEVIITDTVPMDKAEVALGSRLRVLPIAPLIGRALVQITTGGSVSSLFNGHLQYT